MHRSASCEAARPDQSCRGSPAGSLRSWRPSLGRGTSAECGAPLLLPAPGSEQVVEGEEVKPYDPPPRIAHLRGDAVVERNRGVGGPPEQRRHAVLAPQKAQRRPDADLRRDFEQAA